MHPDDLKTIWQCCECGRNFVFHSDVEDHKRIFSHTKLVSRDFSKGRKTLAVFIRGTIALDFKVDSRIAKVIIDYKYYPAVDIINYVDVRYTHKNLQSVIEKNPQMMKNIDNYLRGILRENQANNNSSSSSIPL